MRVHTALSRHRARQGPGEGDGMNAAFMLPRTIKILGEGKTTRAPPRRGGATSRLKLCDRATDVARQHDTGRPQGDKNSGGFNPVPGEHTR